MLRAILQANKYTQPARGLKLRSFAATQFHVNALGVSAGGQACDYSNSSLGGLKGSKAAHQRKCHRDMYPRTSVKIRSFVNSKVTELNPIQKESFLTLKGLSSLILDFQVQIKVVLM